METASKDILSTIAMDSELPDLLRWCMSSKKIYEKVCNNNDVWRNKLLKDYPEYEESKFNLGLSPRETYIFMYQLAYIKKLLNTEKSLHDIFLMKEIYLSYNKGLKKVPRFNLPNLEQLFLSHNNLTQVPDFNLHNLQRLDLRDNQLTKVPDFNLPNLQILDLAYNQLTEVPNFNLPNLESLSLYSNKLKEVPEFNLPKLIRLDLANNQVKEVPGFNLPKLIRLDLYSNKLKEVPPFNLLNLQILSLRENQLTKETKEELKKIYGNKVYF